jgi:3-hydroxyisobutyrate dehydrogenase
MAEACDLIITCLPNPQASAQVLEAPDGILAGLRQGSFWLEMSTTDAREVKRLGALIESAGGHPVDCPVSGGCHRAASGNISIFAGCDRETFEVDSQWQPGCELHHGSGAQGPGVVYGIG